MHVETLEDVNAVMLPSGRHESGIVEASKYIEHSLVTVTGFH